MVAAAAAASPNDDGNNGGGGSSDHPGSLETITPLNNNGEPDDAVISDVSSPVKHRKRRLKTSSLLPPLDVGPRTTVASSASSQPSPRHKRAMRVHTVPASMVLSTATVSPPPLQAAALDGGGGSSGGGLPKSPVKKQRPHSASQHVLLSPLHHHHPHPYSPSAERHQRRKQKQQHHHLIKSPDRSAKTINKIETVRILRARPAFYPSAVAAGGSGKAYKHHHHHHKSKHLEGGPPPVAPPPTAEQLDLPSNVLGKHITLRMDRAGDLKRKRKSPVPSTNLQTAAQQ